jgi:hypothetical protein
MTLSAPAAYARLGVSTQFVDVVLENLKVGHSYNVTQLKNVPYTVKNSGDGPVEIIVDVTLPAANYCKTPYENIPDPTWIQLQPASYRLGGGESGYSNLIISVPDDPKLDGRHFCAQIWGHTKGTGLLGAGVKSDIRFSIGKGPESLEQERQRKAMVNLDYDLYPISLYVRNARPGAYDVKKEEKRSFKITNRAEKPLELVFKALPWQTASMSLPPGYAAVEDLSWVRFVPDRVKVETDTVQDVRLVLDVPKDLKGKKVAFLVQLSLPIGVIVNASNAVYVEIP